MQLNESAKQLMEMDKTCSAAASGCDMPLATETVAVAAAAAVGLAPCSTLASAGAGAAGAAQRQVEGKKNAKKRHSFTALSMTHKSSQAASNRHSMEISAPVLISSSDPRAAARIGDLTHLSSSAPAQVRWTAVGCGHPQQVARPCVTSSEMAHPRMKLSQVLSSWCDGTWHLPFLSLH